MEKIVVGYLYTVSRCIVVISVIKKMNGQYLSMRYMQDIKEEKKLWEEERQSHKKKCRRSRTFRKFWGH